MGNTKQTGFTLVEMSIVLAVLALTIGSVLAGQKMVRQARVNSIIADVKMYESAIGQFKDKYGDVPGDMANATSYWGIAGGNAGDNYTASCYAIQGTGTQTCNGNGDGRIGGNTEAFRFWQQLANAGMIEGSYTGVAGAAGGTDHVIDQNCPASRVPGAGYGIADRGIESGGDSFFDGTYNLTFAYGAYWATHSPMNSAITTAEAYSLDTKFDDGLPATGNIRTLQNGNAYGVSTLCATTAVVATATYNIAAQGNQCSLNFITGY